MIGSKEINKLIIALYNNCNINVQLVRTSRYNPKKRIVFTDYIVEFIKNKKIKDEDGNNKVITCKYKEEKVEGIKELYRYLGELYQKETKRQSDS